MIIQMYNILRTQQMVTMTQGINILYITDLQIGVRVRERLFKPISHLQDHHVPRQSPARTYTSTGQSQGRARALGTILF